MQIKDHKTRCIVERLTDDDVTVDVPRDVSSGRGLGSAVERDVVALSGVDVLRAGGSRYKEYRCN